MKITIQGYLTYQEVLEKRQEELPPNSTLRDLLPSLHANLDLFAHQPEQSNDDIQYPHLIILLNGIHLRHLSLGLETPLKDGDHLAIFPPIAGG